MGERFRFVRDNDGNNYLILTDKKNEFDRWKEAGPYWKDWDGENFNRYSIDGIGEWTFENPKRDE
jgi:hypothetical protein